MGAWGEGMRANDSAADAIFESNVREKFSNGATPNVLRFLRAQYRLFLKDGWGDDCAEDGVLGIADELLDMRVAFDMKARSFVDAIIESRLKEAATWRSPNLRRHALLRFKDRLRGIEHALARRDNKGLFEKIFEKAKALKKNPKAFPLVNAK